MHFRDRREAGRHLAEAVAARVDDADTLVLGLARGGVVVAGDVARRLDAPLDVFVVRKLMAPDDERVAIGALVTGGIQVIHDDLLEQRGIPDAQLAAALAQELRELRRREGALRDGRPHPRVRGRTVVLVDDAICTGATMEAAVAAVRRQGASRVVVAAPVGLEATCAAMGPTVDDVVCLERLATRAQVGRAYERYEPVGDEAVRDALAAGVARV